jgi:hypothetical protein
MIIGIAGHRGSGKSAAAKILVERGFVRQRFAQPLKDMLKAAGLTDEHVDGSLKEVPCELLGGATPRHAMQTLGTEWGRELLHPDLWIILWRARARTTPFVVVDDVRFPNEVEAIRAEGGAIWRIRRPSCGFDGHVSESYINDLAVDHEIDNSGDLDFLRGQLAAALPKNGTP